MTELAQEQRDLPSMVSRVVEGVLDELAKGIGIVVHGPRRIELRLPQAAQVGRIRLLVAGPGAHEAREVRILARSRVGQKSPSCQK